jgi:hypothetical protein
MNSEEIIITLATAVEARIITNDHAAAVLTMDAPLQALVASCLQLVVPAAFDVPAIAQNVCDRRCSCDR